MSEDNLISLYQERSNLANHHASLFWEQIIFFSTIILATITIPIAILQFSGGNLKPIFDWCCIKIEIFQIFPVLGIIFSIFGIVALYRQSIAFYETLYSLSKIREKLNLSEILPENPTTESYQALGFYQIDFNEFDTVKKYVKKYAFRLNPFSLGVKALVKTLFNWIYIFFIIINFILLYYFL